MAEISTSIMNSAKDHMETSVLAFQKELVKLRTGRASATLVNSIQVEYYGSKIPMSQVSNISTPDAKTIQISPWEQSVIPAIEKSIIAEFE